MMPSFHNFHKLLDSEVRAKNMQEVLRGTRGLWWDLRRPSMPDPVFVIGCSRSGTTITYETLASSPQFLSFGWEIPQFWNSLHGPLTNNWASEAATADDARPEHRLAAFRFFYQRLGIGQVLDKTCINVMRVGYLNELFPDSKFVFIQRDGRDNVSSMMDGWRTGRVDGRFELSQFLGPFPEKVSINGGEFREWCFFLAPGWRQYNQARLEEACAFQWITANRLALQAKASIPPHRWIQLRYEDLFDRPVEMFRDTFCRLGVDFTPEIAAQCANLRPTSTVRGTPMRQKWRQYNPEAVERVLETIAPMMSELGYEIGS